MEPMKGFEPPTPSLPWKCSTPELHWQFRGKQKNEQATRLEPATLSLEG